MNAHSALICACLSHGGGGCGLVKDMRVISSSRSNKDAEVVPMRWRKRDLWKIGIIVASTLFLLVFMAWVPVSGVDAHQQSTLITLATGTTTVQATPTEDATVTALSKEKLAQEVTQQQHTWDNWVWSNAAAILSSFLSTLVIVIGALVGLWRWRADRKDAQDKELKDRENEQKKRAEERFQAAVEGLSSERKEAKIGAAILLRTFLRPGYEQFYTQTFDLAVAHLCPTETPHPPEDPDTPLTLTTLRQALIVAFKEAFPLARSQNTGSPQSLDASYIQLDNAYLSGADLERVWMRHASFQEADLTHANLSHANLSGADLSRAYLSDANLSHADLFGVDLSAAHLFEANLRFTHFCRSPKPKRLTRQLFVSNRTEIAKKRMSSYPVIKTFHKLEECLLGLLSGLKGNTIHTFLLEGSEKRLGDGIVIAVAGATHTCRHACLNKYGSIPIARIL